MEPWPAAGRRPQGRRGGAEAARRSDGRTLLHCPGLGVGVDLGVGLGSDFRVRVSDNTQGWMFIALASFGLPIAAGKKTTRSSSAARAEPICRAQRSPRLQRSPQVRRQARRAQRSPKLQRSPQVGRQARRLRLRGVPGRGNAFIADPSRAAASHLALIGHGAMARPRVLARQKGVAGMVPPFMRPPIPSPLVVTCRRSVSRCYCSQRLCTLAARGAAGGVGWPRFPPRARCRRGARHRLDGDKRPLYPRWRSRSR